ncbi:ABC transporter permease [Glycomyces xiaoerkulensis]|uniref:ABC transporter permease n=1 Tax=Glycomyces xiaoerkulensis TaxID=2038139 RepID=UPI000C25AD81|nr:ABC transporter permease [Glycomyces xiaoerkulensis]
MTAADVPVHRPGPRAWLLLIAAEAKMVARDTSGLIVPLGLPLLILVMNGFSYAGETTADGIDVFELYVMPIALTIVIASVGVINMPSFLVYYRRTKVLRRLGATPAHPAMILVAQMVVAAVQSIAGIAVGVAAAMLFFGVGLPTDLGLALAVLGLAALTMFAVGMIVAAVAPTPSSGVAFGLVGFLLLGATGGMFGPTENLPGPVAAVGEVLPFGAAVQAVGNAWVGLEQNPAHLLAMVAAIAVSVAIAVRFFRWE